MLLIELPGFKPRNHSSNHRPWHERELSKCSQNTWPTKGLTKVYKSEEQRKGGKEERKEGRGRERGGRKAGWLLLSDQVSKPESIVQMFSYRVCPPTFCSPLIRTVESWCICKHFHPNTTKTDKNGKGAPAFLLVIYHGCLESTIIFRGRTHNTHFLGWNNNS